MVVESGFSAMKASETEMKYMSHLDIQTYNALRVIQGYWNRDTFETFEIPVELHNLVLKAGQEYKTLSKEKAIEATRKRTYAEDLREEVHVFKRRSTHDIQRQINDTKKIRRQATNA